MEVNEPIIEPFPMPAEVVMSDSRPAPAPATTPPAAATTPPPDATDAPVVAAVAIVARPVEAAPLIKCEPAREPNEIDFPMMTGAAMVLKII
jgi:hypothetical protein